MNLFADTDEVAKLLYGEGAMVSRAVAAHTAMLDDYYALETRFYEPEKCWAIFGRDKLTGIEKKLASLGFEADSTGLLLGAVFWLVGVNPANQEEFRKDFEAYQMSLGAIECLTQ